jgi:hypothetical protein
MVWGGRTGGLVRTISDSDDERRGVGVSAAASEETGVVVRHEESGDGERDHVEEQDAPEDLLDSFGEFDARVPCLGCCETDEFGSREREGGRDEDAAEAFEAVVEGAGLVPCASAQVASVVGRDATAVDDDAENDKGDDRDDFDD